VFWTGLGQTGAFAIVSICLWWLMLALCSGLPWFENRLLLSVFSLLAAAVAVTVLFVKAVALKPLAEAGMGWHPNEGRYCLLGGALGGGLALTIVLVQVAAGWAELVPAAGNAPAVWSGPAVWGAIVLGAGAAGEELLFRGYGFQKLVQAASPWAAVAATSVIFALLHGGNPSSTPVALVNTLLFGAVFALALILHRSWWLPFGLHWGWNLTLALLGAKISGLTIKLTDISVAVRGQALWTGGAYGPEGGLLATAGVCGLAWALLKLPRRPAAGPRLWDKPPLRET